MEESAGHDCAIDEMLLRAISRNLQDPSAIMLDAFAYALAQGSEQDDFGSIYKPNAELDELLSKLKMCNQVHNIRGYYYVYV